MNIENAKNQYKVLKNNLFMVRSIDKNFFIKFGKTTLDEIEKKDNIIKKYEEMIINHKNILHKNGIIGYDCDLKILNEEE